VLEFLDLAANYAETDLHRALLLNLKDFLIELGRDFSFVRSQYPLQVGGREFALDFCSSTLAEQPGCCRIKGGPLRA
jgi:predicted nuclease of restriction endonuclease-like (RecB) superfamily